MHKQIQSLNRSSHQRCSVTNNILRIFGKFTGKHLCLFFNKVSSPGKRLFFNKVAGLRTPFYRTHPDDCFCLNVTFTLSTPDQRIISNTFYKIINTFIYSFSLLSFFYPFCSDDLFINHIKDCVFIISCKRFEWIFFTHWHCSKMKFSTKDFFSKCGQIRRKLWIWSDLLKKSLKVH